MKGITAFTVCLIVLVGVGLVACDQGRNLPASVDDNEASLLRSELNSAVAAGDLERGSSPAATNTPDASPQTRPPLKTKFTRPEDLGGGFLSTFISTHRKVPVYLGVVFSGDALDGLPGGVSDGRYDIKDAEGNTVWHCCGHETAVELPKLAKKATAFEHFVLNWNPEGHIPSHIYDVPHFDLHFYTVTMAERLAIGVPSAETMCEVPGPEGPVKAPLDCPTFEQAMVPLPADMTPPDYLSVGAVEPAMGNHLIDFSSPEFSPAGFSSTWIYGANKGEITYWEPMITKAYFESEPFECTDLKLPQAAPEAGYYPSRYCTRYFAALDLYAVTLEGFGYLPKSNGVVQ